MEVIQLIIGIVFGVIFSNWGGNIAKRKGRSISKAQWLCFFTGLMGILIVSSLKNKTSYEKI